MICSAEKVLVPPSKLFSLCCLRTIVLEWVKAQNPKASTIMAENASFFPLLISIKQTWTRFLLQLPTLLFTSSHHTPRLAQGHVLHSTRRSEKNLGRAKENLFYYMLCSTERTAFFIHLLLVHMIQHPYSIILIYFIYFYIKRFCEQMLCFHTV